MERLSAITKVLLLLTFSAHLSSADTHSLQYLYTVVTGINFPEFTAVGLLDEEQVVYYDSNTRKTIPKTEWIKKISNDVPHFWNRHTQILQGEQERLGVIVAKTIQRFNQSKEVHTVQVMYGCELDDDGTTRGYNQYGYDGEDFISLDLIAVSWIPVKPQAVITESKWESKGHEAKYCKDYLRYECIERLKTFVSYGKETLERKVHPEVSLFQNHSSPPELVCHATGFFPKTVLITWQKDGEDVHEDVDLGETLPNQDGSFQKRSILTVSAEDLQKHTYTCVIQHSSLEKKMVLHEEDIRILNPDRRTGGGSGGGSDEGSGGGSGGAPIGIIVGVVVALVVFIAGVAGIVVWKKKNSDSTPVPLSDSTPVPLSDSTPVPLSDYTPVPLSDYTPVPVSDSDIHLK